MRNGLTQSSQAIFDVLLNLFVVGSYGTHQGGFTRDDTAGNWVARLHGANADNRLIKRRHTARHHALRSRDDVRGHQNRIDRLMWPCTMTTLAQYVNANGIGRGLHRAGCDTNHAQRGIW